MARTEESTVQLLHFRVGEDAGKLLTTIAREHLIYNYNPNKALDTLESSFGGECPRELTLAIIKGDMVVLVDTEEQQFIVTRFESGIHDRIGFEKLNVVDWAIKQCRLIHDNGMGLKKAIDEILYRMNYKKIYKTYDYGQILKFIAGNNDIILDDLRDTQEVSELAGLVSVVKSYIEKSMRTWSVVDWMRKSYPEDFAGISDFSEYNQTLQMVIRKFNDVLTLDFSEIEKEQKSLTNYIESAREIDEVLSKGIEPVDIMSNYTAGWLAPNGDYYALNGEIANMLHNQIADALKDAGIISEDNDNPDAWLEQQGWVKIHGNDVQFAGCLNSKMISGKRNINMTPIQIKKIYEYCTIYHKGIIKLGWRQEQISAILFKDVAESNIEALNKKYFEF